MEQVDALVAELMQHLASSFADVRGRLERYWDRGDDVPTDDLRDAFQRYRSSSSDSWQPDTERDLCW